MYIFSREFGQLFLFVNLKTFLHLKNETSFLAVPKRLLRRGQVEEKTVPYLAKFEHNCFYTQAVVCFSMIAMLLRSNCSEHKQPAWLCRRFREHAEKQFSFFAYPWQLIFWRMFHADDCHGLGSEFGQVSRDKYLAIELEFLMFPIIDDYNDIANAQNFNMYCTSVWFLDSGKNCVSAHMISKIERNCAFNLLAYWRSYISQQFSIFLLYFSILVFNFSWNEWDVKHVLLYPHVVFCPFQTIFLCGIPFSVMWSCEIWSFGRSNHYGMTSLFDTIAPFPLSRIKSASLSWARCSAS